MKIHFFKKKDKKENKKLIRKKDETPKKKVTLKSKEKTVLEKLKASKRKTKIVAAALLISIFTNLSLGAYQHAQIQIREEEIQSRQEEVESVNAQMEELTEKLKAGEIKENEYKEKIEKLEKEKNELNEQLQAKLKARANNNVVAAAVPTYNVQGSCADWIRQAGVSDIENAYTLIMRESGCNVNSVNKSSGACGIPQALPCSKLGSARGNPVAEIQWMNNYVVNRYGSWANAVAFWNAHHWY